MTYARLENGSIAEYPIYEGDIKLRHRNTSFTTPFSPPDGYVAIKPSVPPTPGHTEELAEGIPVFDGQEWHQTWEVKALTNEVIEERVKQRSSGVRDERNQLLAKCDWTQLPDAPVDAAAWSAYRQALRDITTQSGFPWEITWPKKPA